MISLRIKTGEIIDMPGARFRVARELSGGSLLFTREDTLGETIVSEHEIEELIAAGKFCRVGTHSNARGRDEPNPIAEIPPEGASEEARAKIFYVRKWLENPTSKSDKKLEQFIERTAPIARARGITYTPKKAMLRRAIYAYLNQGRQTTAAIASRRGKVPRQPKMNQCVAEIMTRTVAWYYAERAHDYGQAHAWLVKFIDKINRRASRQFEGWKDLTPPNEETTRAHIRAADALVPEWLQRGSGHFVSIASAAGLLTQVGAAGYAVSKHAAVGFAEWLAITYGDNGIGVTCVCPMGVATPLLDDITDSADAATRVAGAAVTTAGEVLSADQVAAATLAGVRDDRFLVLPHPAVLDMYRGKGADYERWIAGMRRYQRSLGG
jgi:hypothetical protein